MAARPGLVALLLAGLAGCAAPPLLDAPSRPAPAGTAFGPAPVPGDTPLPPGRGGVEAGPTVLRSVTVPRGSGYLPGSTYRNREDLPSTRGLGAAVRVPFNPF